MRRRALLVSLVATGVWAQACRAFGEAASTGTPDTAADEGPDAATGAGDANGAAVRFCAQHTDAVLCDDFDNPLQALFTRWTMVRLEGDGPVKELLRVADNEAPSAPHVAFAKVESAVEGTLNGGADARLARAFPGTPALLSVRFFVRAEAMDRTRPEALTVTPPFGVAAIRVPGHTYELVLDRGGSDPFAPTVRARLLLPDGSRQLVVGDLPIDAWHVASLHLRIQPSFAVVASFDGIQTSVGVEAAAANGPPTSNDPVTVFVGPTALVADSRGAFRFDDVAIHAE